MWWGGGGVIFRSGQFRARNQDWLMSSDGWPDLGQVRTGYVHPVRIRLGWADVVYQVTTQG